MQKALNTDNELIDIHHSGTAMRFLTAYFACRVGKTVILTGSERMRQRPIKILVDALIKLGANIEYLENEGFPPLKIIGKEIIKSKVSLSANVSSQYISALMLIAPSLKNGLEIELIGEITSRPYIEMTLELLKNIGVETSFNDNCIKINHLQFTICHSSFKIESDWSSASYFYSIVALSKIGTEISLSNFYENSLQGDSALVEIYKNFGVETIFETGLIIIKKINNCQLSIINYQLNNCPDLAQTLAVTCFGLGIECHLSGLQTLKIKETDRLLAMQAELQKLGAMVQITSDSISITKGNYLSESLSIVAIDTYNDHRMAMAFAPLAIKFPIIINNAEVVSKSYPNFWEDIKKIGFDIKKLI
jgi:3-phosphoshikimate 1-carboxyvinyltransferase